jgi:hypothetical protein
MSLNLEFLGRLDREIANIRGRLRERKEQAAVGTLAWNGEALLQETEARLKHLEEMRAHIMMQGHGG